MIHNHGTSPGAMQRNANKQTNKKHGVRECLLAIMNYWWEAVGVLTLTLSVRCEYMW
jgi:hypothetical protein